MSDSKLLPQTPDEVLSHEVPLSPTSVGSSQASTPLDDGASSPSGIPQRVPSLRSISDPSTSNLMNPTSTPQGFLNKARGGTPAASQLDLLAKARAFQQSRMGLKTSGSMGSSPASQSPVGPGTPVGGFPGGMNLNMSGIRGGMAPRPGAPGSIMSDSVIPMARVPGGLAGRRGLKLGQMPGNPAAGLSSPPMKLPSANGEGARPALNGAGQGTRLSDFEKYIDSEKGWITFDGDATITKEGVQFSNGTSFKISLNQIEVLDELGKGNYGTVYKVRHAKPNVPRFGTGLTGFRKAQNQRPSPSSTTASAPRLDTTDAISNRNSGRVMAMKEIRLELEESKIKTILKELVILHSCTSPFIIDFYGAFFQEGSVYMCIEYMDGGSVDQLYAGGIPEQVMRKITYATVVGLKYLKEKHSIIHRDVKPTNVLVNTKGQVKICDFGVSGNLVASMAKTQIGCQSYMAPERITQGNATFSSMGQGESTYSVSSDIWSLGLSVIECAIGKYPYPPEVSSSILGQLNAIVEGQPSDLPDTYSSTAKDFVKSCLHKVPAMRPSYADLLNHAWLAHFAKPDTIAEEDEEDENGDTKATSSSLAKDLNELKLDLNSCSVETGDPEVAEWAKEALKKKLEDDVDGKKNKMKPALHNVAIDPAGGPAVR